MKHTYREQCSEGHSLGKKRDREKKAQDLESDGLGVKYQTQYLPMIGPWTANL